MKRIALFMMATALFAPLFASGSDDVGSEKLELSLQRPLMSYSVSGDTFVQALAKAAARFEVPMGIEWLDSADTLKHISVKGKNATVEQVLIKIVSSQAGYQSKVENGVFHVFPSGALDDDLSFLNLRIKSFHVENEFVEFAGFKLKTLIRHILYPAEAKTGSSGSAGSLATGMGDKRVSFELHDARVRDVLDKFVVSTDRRIWLVTYPPHNEIADSGQKRVISIYNAHIADKYQPVWDLLIWGFDPSDKLYRPEWVSTSTSH